jgi:hypothetical protein
MVEVAGVEPASLELLRKASTCLFSFLISLGESRRNRATQLASPLKKYGLGAGDSHPGYAR